MVEQEAMWLTCLLEGRKEVPNRGKIKSVELLSDNIFLIIIEREQKKKGKFKSKFVNLHPQLLCVYCFKTL